MIDPKLMEELIAIGLPGTKLKAVLTIINKIYAKEEDRLAGQRERAKKHRNKVAASRSLNVQKTFDEREVPIYNISSYVSNNTEVLTELSKISKISKIRVGNQKKTKKIKLPGDWKPSFENLQYAQAAGYSDQQIDWIAKGFVDHSVNKGTMRANWNLAWENWVQNAVLWGRPKPQNWTDPKIVPMPLLAQTTQNNSSKPDIAAAVAQAQRNLNGQ